MIIVSVILIIGGAKRIGRALVQTYAKESPVFFTFHHSKKEALALSKQRNRKPIHYSQLDLSSTTAIQKFAQTFKNSSLEALIYLASSFYPTPFGQVTAPEWNDIADTNLKAVFFLIQSLAVKLQPGSNIQVINDSMLNQFSENFLPYTIAKTGLTQLTRTLAKSLAPQTRINELALGCILPPKNFSKSKIKSYAKKVPLQCWGGSCAGDCGFAFSPSAILYYRDIPGDRWRRFAVSSLVYQPTGSWIKQSHIQNFLQRSGCQDFNALLLKSQTELEWFWTLALKDIDLLFAKPYSKLLSQGLPFPNWATDAEISIVENCIDRHLATHPDKTAVIFESDSPGKSVQWSFKELARESSFVTQLLQTAGAQPGDRAALLMPMSLEMLASFFGILRAGLTVIPIFSGYGVEAVQTRLADAEAKFVFVQEKTFRRGKEIKVRATLDEALKSAPSVKKVFTLSREDFTNGHLDTKIIPSLARPAESECLILYTSGTTGKPKACVHTPFGVLATTGKELRYAFDVKKHDRFFWYTDIGWMMGPWEIFGTLQFGATVVLYEGVPDFPDSNRLWEMIDHHQVTQLGISPTAVRVLKKNETPATFEKYSLTSLRILGSSGEPWDEETWTWFFEKVGKKNCPIINISGGTEMMGCLLMPTPLHSLKPCSLGGPILGVGAQVWTEDGKPISQGLGHLVCTTPLPSMTKGFLNSPERYLQTYFEKFGEKVWYHGDWAFIDDDGQWFLRGRSDDTIKVAGKRVGPSEYESALMEDNRVAEVAAIGLPHALKGETVNCFVVLKDLTLQSENTRAELLVRATLKMGKALAPDKILFTAALPKTRSGKILRATIKKIFLNEAYDTATIENSDSIVAIQKSG